MTILAVAAIATVASASGMFKFSVRGEGAMGVRTAKTGRVLARQFSFEASVSPDGIVSGSAVLVNPEFEGTDVGEPFTLEMDISCMNVIGDEAFFGGTVKRTSDQNLVDAAYFSVQDGGTSDSKKMSRVYFFDDDPNTSGDPQLCMGNYPGDFLLEPIVTGSIDIKKRPDNVAVGTR
jgi:hypothetical protein